MKTSLNKDFSKQSYLLNVDEHYDRSQSLIKLQFTGYEEIGPKYHLVRSKYDSIMFTYTLDGSWHMLHNNRYVLVKPETLTILDCQDDLEAWPATNYKILFIHFTGSFLPSYVKYINDMVGSETIEMKNDPLNIKNMILSLHKDIKENNFDENKWSATIFSKLMQIKTYVEKNTGTKTKEINTYVSLTTAFIKENLNKKITIKDCARNVNLAPTYLESLFKNVTGETIHDFILKTKFQEAKNLLVTEKMFLDEIAEKCGLNDSQTLIRLFKKMLGMTPKQYIKSIRL